MASIASAVEAAAGGPLVDVDSGGGLADFSYRIKRVAIAVHLNISTAPAAAPPTYVMRKDGFAPNRIVISAISRSPAFARKMKTDCRMISPHWDARRKLPSTARSTAKSSLDLI